MLLSSVLLVLPEHHSIYWRVMVSNLLERDRRSKKAKLLKNSTMLKIYKSSNYPQIISVIDHLYDEMIKSCGLNLTRPSDIKRLRYHIEFLALNLYKTYCNDPTKLISYPRAANAYHSLSWPRQPPLCTSTGLSPGRVSLSHSR